MIINQVITTSYLASTHESKFIGQALDPTDVLYSYLFNHEVSLKDRNKYLLLFLQEHISKGNLTTVKKVLLKTDTFHELHVSFLKAMLIMTEHVDEVAELRAQLSEIYAYRIK